MQIPLPKKASNSNEKSLSEDTLSADSFESIEKKTPKKDDMIEDVQETMIAEGEYLELDAKDDMQNCSEC